MDTLYPEFNLRITGELITHSLKDKLENPDIDPNIKIWSYINFAKRVLAGNNHLESFQQFIKELQSTNPIQDLNTHLGLSNQTEREKVLKYIEQDLNSLTNAKNITDINVYTLSLPQYLKSIEPHNGFTLPA